ncbi:Cys-Gln thioester bond-forming surface protein [Streptomyces roseirectus]|uniref:Cys-Gln thioester bond-forming surface protein n=1 Tax=Streptomyces roseirectus TaxID=2768066 RepID=A0A7H0IT40_9ACTN|nr:Cys-Gln thioester bond-forming surface protein [Streptomyces roseirectus]
MPFARARGAVRAVAVTLVSGLAAAGILAAAAPAVADTATQGQGGATATIGGLKVYGGAVLHEEGGDQEIPAGLFEMSVDGGGMLQTYCVDVYTPTQKDAKYHETPWSGTSLAANKQAGRIGWILQHSYPQVNDLAWLAKSAGIKSGLTEQDAAAGTQVAIWRYSDGADVDAVDPQARQLADYLEKAARGAAEPAASLTVDSPAVSGKPGELLGPVTVRTDAGTVSVTPPPDAAISGVKVVDADGAPVTSAGDGSRLYFQVPAAAPAGSAQVTLQASTTVPVGRAFVSEGRSQTQILAGSSESTVSATAVASWGAVGAVPALSAARDCLKGGLDITATNKGDQPYTFTLLAAEYTIGAGETRTVTVPLQEDQPYDFALTTPQGNTPRFTGILDCKTQSRTTSNLTTQTFSDPTPATVLPATPTNLADTGTDSTTPLIAGTAIGLVLIGGTALVLTARKNQGTGE